MYSPTVEKTGKCRYVERDTSISYLKLENRGLTLIYLTNTSRIGDIQNKMIQKPLLQAN